MTSILNFQGFIKGVAYRAYLVEELRRYRFLDFDVNTASSYGVIELENGELAYSKWVSPKRTRSYPFARIYNTYNSQKVLTIIPIIKDEGLDGDLDKLQYSTISWMNLLNVYIVLGYYETASKNISEKQRGKQKITNQQFNNHFIKSQILEISQYKQSALHWNKNLFEEKFTDIFERALNSYSRISSTTGVQIHPQSRLRNYLEKVRHDFEKFKDISLRSSYRASVREVKTSHQLEYLADGLKATFCIHNYLGGIYYLTTDEVILKNGLWIIQESKNSRDKPLPDLSDIQDGLFKLIIFSNLSSLQLTNTEVMFAVKLKLTGRNIRGSILLPSPEEELENFLAINSTALNKEHKKIIKKLQIEVTHNQPLKIEIGCNS